MLVNMVILKIKPMQGQEETSVFMEVLDFLLEIAPWATIVITFWKFIDWLAKYMEDTRKSRVKDIVVEVIKEVTTPQMDKLSKSIDELKEAIWDMKKK